MVVKPEIREVQVPVYVALPDGLTADEAEPPPPARRCTWQGEPTVCNKDGADYLEAVRAWGRRGWSRVREIRAVQPPLEPQP